MRRNKGGGGLIPSPFTYAIRRLNEVPYEVLRGGTKVLGEGCGTIHIVLNEGSGSFE